MEIYTIGYTAFSEYGVHDLSRFICALKKYKITCLVDVRSEPNSKTRFEFNKDNLQKELKENGILYRNYAYEFGARQDNNYFYDLSREDGHNVLNFKKFISSEQFQSGIEKIKKGIELGYIFCIMCSEKDPINCHRALMVGRGFKEAGFSVLHIKQKNSNEELKQHMPDRYEIESQDGIEKRLKDKYYKKSNELWGQREFGDNSGEIVSNEPTIDDCYQQENKQIGYDPQSKKEGKEE